MPPCRICCSTGWSGSCAMPISSRGWRRSSRITATASRRWRPRSTARCRSRRWPRAMRGWRSSPRPACRRRWRAASPAFRVLKAAPDIVLVADQSKKPVGEVTATYFATEAFFQLDRVIGAVPGIVVSDYFDRLALDRALDSIGDAERRLTAAMVGNGGGRRRRGGGMGQAAAGRSRAHPRGDPRDRRLGADAVEAVGGGEFAGGFGAGVASVPSPAGRVDAQRRGGVVANRSASTRPRSRPSPAGEG